MNTKKGQIEVLGPYVIVLFRKKRETKISRTEGLSKTGTHYIPMTNVTIRTSEVHGMKNVVSFKVLSY